MSNDDAVIMQILAALDTVYPNPMCMRKLRENVENFSREHTRALHALAEEGYVKPVDGTTLDGVALAGASITPKGQRRLAGKEDFVTVKLHEETVEALRAMLLASVTKTSLPEKQKGAWKTAIESAPSTAVGEVVTRIVAAGLERAPELLTQITTLLSR